MAPNTSVEYTRKVGGSVHAISSARGDVRGVLGYGRREVLVSNWWLRHLHPEDRMDVLNALDALLVEDQWTIEYRCRNKDGSYRWIHDEARVRRDATGRPTEIVGTWRDVSAERAH